MKNGTAAIYTNGTMRLRLIAKNGSNAAFERLNEDGTGFDYVIGKDCTFNHKEMTVSWCWGCYPMHHEYFKIIDQLNRS